MHNRLQLEVQVCEAFELEQNRLSAQHLNHIVSAFLRGNRIQMNCFVTNE